MPYLGWYEPDRKMEARQKLGHAIDRFATKFGRIPKHVLCSPQDALDLATPTRNFPGELPVEVHAKSCIARHMFYVGEDMERRSDATHVE